MAPRMQLGALELRWPLQPGCSISIALLSGCTGPFRKNPTILAGAWGLGERKGSVQCAWAAGPDLPSDRREAASGEVSGRADGGWGDQGSSQTSLLLHAVKYQLSLRTRDRVPPCAPLPAPAKAAQVWVLNFRGSHMR